MTRKICNPAWCVMVLAVLSLSSTTARESTRRPDRATRPTDAETTINLAAEGDTAEPAPADCGCNCSDTVTDEWNGLRIIPLVEGDLIDAFPELRRLNSVSELERKTFLESEEEKKYQARRAELLASWPKKRFKLVFFGSDISDYDVQLQAFKILLKVRSPIDRGLPPFDAIDISSYDVFWLGELPTIMKEPRNSWEYYQVALVVKFPEAKALEIERGRDRIRPEICFTPTANLKTAVHHYESGETVEEKFLLIRNPVVRFVNLDGRVQHEVKY